MTHFFYFNFLPDRPTHHHKKQGDGKRIILLGWPLTNTITSFLTDKPSAPVILNKETQVSGCDVNLRWSFPEDNGCPLTLYTIYYRELQLRNEDSWHKINVTKVTKSEHLLSLKCNTEYTFAVSAWNELGESPFSSEWPISLKTSKTSKGMVSMFLKEFFCKERK